MSAYPVLCLRDDGLTVQERRVSPLMHLHNDDRVSKRRTYLQALDVASQQLSLPAVPARGLATPAVYPLYGTTHALVDADLQSGKLDWRLLWLGRWLLEKMHATTSSMNWPEPDEMLQGRYCTLAVVGSNDIR